MPLQQMVCLRSELIAKKLSVFNRLFYLAKSKKSFCKYNSNSDKHTAPISAVNISVTRVGDSKILFPIKEPSKPEAPPMMRWTGLCGVKQMDNINPIIIPIIKFTIIIYSLPPLLSIITLIIKIKLKYLN